MLQSSGEAYSKGQEMKSERIYGFNTIADFYFEVILVGRINNILFSQHSCVIVKSPEDIF